MTAMPNAPVLPGTDVPPPPTAHRTSAELEAGLHHLHASPRDAGVVELVVCRPTKGTRRVLDEGVLDLSEANLPVGTRLAVGTAVLEITPARHTGCAVFLRHDGPDATRFVNSRVGRALRLRGVNARVVVAGSVRPGDAVVKA